MTGHSRWADIQYRRGGRPRRRPDAACQPVRYEGYGPGGAAVMLECLTDDRNRTAAQVRHVFRHHGGCLGAHDAVAYLFNHVGVLAYPAGANEKRLQRVALAAGAEDVVAHADGRVEVLTDPAEFTTVHARLVRAGLAPVEARVTQRAAAAVELDGPAAYCMVQLLEALEALDGVQHVYSNAEISDEILAGL